jgi:hypothetical protein
VSHARRIVSLLALSLSISGCGYRFAAGPATLPEGIRAVSAPVFVNNTAEPGLQVVFTQALRDELARSGVESRSDADAELSGELAAVWGGPSLLTTPSQPKLTADAFLASYRVFATARLRLTKAGKALGSLEVMGSEDYLPGADVVQTEANRQLALRRLAGRLMREGCERLR